MCYDDKLILVPPLYQLKILSSDFSKVYFLTHTLSSTFPDLFCIHSYFIAVRLATVNLPYPQSLIWNKDQSRSNQTSESMLAPSDPTTMCMIPSSTQRSLYTLHVRS